MGVKQLSKHPTNGWKYHVSKTRGFPCWYVLTRILWFSLVLVSSLTHTHAGHSSGRQQIKRPDLRPLARKNQAGSFGEQRAPDNMWEKDLRSPQHFVPLLSGHFVRDVSFPPNSKPFLALQMLKILWGKVKDRSNYLFTALGTIKMSLQESHLMWSLLISAWGHLLSGN